MIPGASVRVFNGAVGSYRIHHNFMQYLTTLRALSPDLIISIDGFNESFDLENPFFYS